MTMYVSEPDWWTDPQMRPITDSELRELYLIHGWVAGGMDHVLELIFPTCQELCAQYRGLLLTGDDGHPRNPLYDVEQLRRRVDECCLKSAGNVFDTLKCSNMFFYAHQDETYIKWGESFAYLYGWWRRSMCYHIFDLDDNPIHDALANEILADIRWSQIAEILDQFFWRFLNAATDPNVTELEVRSYL